MTNTAINATPARRKAGNATAARQPKKARKDTVSGAALKPDTHGQVFTPAVLVNEMLALRQNKGRVLEPSCGSGAFSNGLHQAGADLVALELDRSHAPAYAKVGDFFDYPMGFGADGRFEFVQRALENVLLPAEVVSKLNQAVIQKKIGG